MVEEDKALLLAYLNSARDHVVATVEGVSDADQRRPIVPSGWSMLGLVQHLALDVERFWFRAVMAGQDVVLCTGSQAWRVDEEVSSAAVIEAYRTECALADEVIRRTGLEAPAAGRRAEWGSLEVESLLDVIIHVIKETATHAGHLDVARELIDGHQHLVVT